MYEIKKFQPDHGQFLLDKYSGEHLPSGYLPSPDALSFLANQSYSYSGFVDGVVAVAGGCLECWPCRYFIWVIFNRDFDGNKFLPVARIFKEMLKDYFPKGRLEFANPVGYEVGQRRAEFLGFTMEAKRMINFYPGSDWELWARMNL